MKKAAVLSVFFFLGPAAAQEISVSTASVHNSQSTAPVVAQVRFQRQNVFDLNEPSQDIRLFRLANRLHVVTREYVLRREVLLKPGQPADPALLAESERLLRRLGFIRRAEGRFEANPDGTQDAVFETDDDWTIEGLVSFGRQGGRNTWRAGASDRNLLGTGKKVNLSYAREGSGDSRRFEYRDPQLFGTRWRADFDKESGPEIDNLYAAVQRPFRATVDPYEVRFSGGRNDEEIDHAVGAQRAGRVRREIRAVETSLGRSFGSTTQRVRRLNAAFRHSRTEFSTVPGETVIALERMRRENAVLLTGQWEKVDFVKLQRIDAMFRDEDFGLGPGVDVLLGAAPIWLGSTDESFTAGLTLRRGGSWGGKRLLSAQAGVLGGVTDLRAENMVWRGALLFYERHASWATLAARAAYDHGYKLEPVDGLSLGEDEGLRGYSLDQFRGNRRLRLNLEERLFFWDDLFHLLSAGAAAFVDSGYVWPQGRAFALRDLRTSVGAGLRLGSSRSGSGQPARIDLAYALRNNGQSGRWVLSIQTRQAFGREP